MKKVINIHIEYNLPPKENSVTLKKELIKLISDFTNKKKTEGYDITTRSMEFDK